MQAVGSSESQVSCGLFFARARGTGGGGIARARVKIKLEGCRGDNILNTSNRFVYSVLDVSYKLTSPALNFIRRYLPNLGSIDISPVILILGLMFLRNFVFEMFALGLF